MKNIIQGWFFTLMGIILMLAATADYFGIIQVPAPEGLSETHQIAFAFFIGLAMVVLPPTWVEEKIKSIIDKKTDKL